MPIVLVVAVGEGPPQAARAVVLNKQIMRMLMSRVRRDDAGFIVCFPPLIATIALVPGLELILYARHGEGSE
jgi:hypothetical protein